MYYFPFRFSPNRMNQTGFMGGCQRGPSCGCPQKTVEPVYRTAPSAGCQKSDPNLGWEREMLPAVKCSATGDIILPNHTKQGDTYNIAAINLDTANYCRFLVDLNFSCNICMTNASLHLRFQIFKQGICSLKAVPAGPGFHYFREAPSTESNVITFSACDYDSSKSSHLNYSVYVEVMGGETAGTTAITNPVLIAAITRL